VNIFPQVADAFQTLCINFLRLFEFLLPWRILVAITVKEWISEWIVMWDTLFHVLMIQYWKRNNSFRRNAKNPMASKTDVVDIYKFLINRKPGDGSRMPSIKGTSIVPLVSHFVHDCYQKAKHTRDPKAQGKWSRRHSGPLVCFGILFPIVFAIVFVILVSYCIYNISNYYFELCL
jgi:hypothetical protein